MLEHSNSFKEFGFILISGEVGFNQVNPPNPRNVYEHFISTFLNVKKRTKRKQFANLEFGFHSENDDWIQFEVNHSYDWRKLVEMVNHINTMNKMSGNTVCDIAVGINIDYIYESVGKLANENDEYFEVIKELWKSFKASNPKEEKMKDKIRRLKHSFILSDGRISELEAI